jgi:hypothetical protein
MSAHIDLFPPRGSTPLDDPGAAGDGRAVILPRIPAITQIVLDGQHGLIAVGGVHHGLQYVRPVVRLSCGEARRGSAPLAGMLSRMIFGGWEADFQDEWL